LNEPERQRSFPEFVTYAVSLAVLALLVGGLGYVWMRGDDAPPLLEIELGLGDIEQRNEAWYLPVSVTNHGDQSAQDVVVEVALGEETRSFTIALMPGGATRAGTVIFSTDPAKGDVTAEVVSFISP
jgi:uncharacterized protein (TIGR02588 family)